MHPAMAWWMWSMAMTRVCHDPLGDFGGLPDSQNRVTGVQRRNRPLARRSLFLTSPGGASNLTAQSGSLDSHKERPNMDGRDSIQSLLVRRKLTRAIADLARAQMLEYLAVLAPLLRPRTVLGDFIHGASKEGAPRAEKAYKQLQALYAAIAPARRTDLAWMCCRSHRRAGRSGGAA